ncbi:hypothetical protein [Mariniplasma anaerobium]|uniref:Uncharacterized protein n=1 Tax=Mariniplasma anaerobium TaxID=2735436 RepID=A0A7U9XWE7_9MOLU|nr:hypothetical protein [Mariniplasma anaerobium]BCR35193.1 hypothetical protein MPAN_000860 [Mariniplasma anaerobium]
MLNQCIFVGRVQKIESFNSEVLKVTLDIITNNDNHNKIGIEIPDKMIDESYIRKGNLMGIKAKVSSSDAQTYKFIAERLTVLGVKDDEA